MLNRLSLRLRVFLFFCLLACGGITIVLASLFIGFQRANLPELQDAFVFSGVIAGFSLLAMVAGIWLMFDENVAKPIERLASEMRSRAHAGVDGAMDLQAARYLGDLAPAAQAVAGQLSGATLSTAETVAAETARLETEKDRLTALLTDIPMAIVILNPAHQIVLYDGQAAAILAQVAIPRLQASLFDYLEPKTILAAYEELMRTGTPTRCSASNADGDQSFDLLLKPMGAAPGYMLILENSPAQTQAIAARPLVYDFDLLNTSDDTAFADTALNDLCFVVFDSETTGLDSKTDDVVQIGAVRILKGRIIEGEVLDMLVDPGRPIPAASTRVHGISTAMVAGAPGIDIAGRALHRFAHDAVIVAHNAPFDMAFLHRHSDDMSVTWDHPVLDTVLVSAVIFGASVPHTLDALCDRLDVTIPESLRHTALGDAQATAEVLCKMLPMLQARGMQCFGDVIAETRKHGRLLKDLN